MGKTTKPLTLVVHPSLYDAPDFVALRAQGHRVVNMDDCRVVFGEEGDDILTSVDMILGVNAWWFEPRQLNLLDRVLEIARKRRYVRDQSKKKEASDT